VREQGASSLLGRAFFCLRFLLLWRFTKVLLFERVFPLRFFGGGIHGVRGRHAFDRSPLGQRKRVKSTLDSYSGML